MSDYEDDYEDSCDSCCMYKYKQDFELSQIDDFPDQTKLDKFKKFQKNLLKYLNHDNELFNIGCGTKALPFLLHYYQNRDKLKYAREVYYLAECFCYLNYLVQAGKLFYQALNMCNPITKDDIPSSLGCGTFFFKERFPKTRCNSIGPNLFYFLHEELNIKIFNSETFLFMETKEQGEEELIDFISRRMYFKNVSCLKYGLENDYRKRKHANHKALIQNMNLYSQDLVGIIREKSREYFDKNYDDETNEKFITFSLFLLEQVWIYQNNNFVKCGLFIDCPIIKIGESFKYDKNIPEHVTTYGTCELTSQVNTCIDLVTKYLKNINKDDVDKLYEKLTKLLTYFSLYEHAKFIKELNIKPDLYPLFKLKDFEYYEENFKDDSDKYDQSVEHIKDDKDKKHMKYILSSVHFYKSKFKEIYPETIVSKELVFFKFYKDQAYEINHPVDSSKFIYCYGNGHISKCAKGELFDAKIWCIMN